MEARQPAFAVVPQRQYLLSSAQIIVGDTDEFWLKLPQQPTVMAVSLRAPRASLEMCVGVLPGYTITSVVLAGERIQITNMDSWARALVRFRITKKMAIRFSRPDPKPLVRGYGRPGDRNPTKPFTTAQVAFMKTQFHHSPARILGKQAVTNQKSVLEAEYWLTAEQIDSWYGRYFKALKDNGAAALVAKATALVPTADGGEESGGEEQGGSGDGGAGSECW
jgi:hypothetical protein